MPGAAAAQVAVSDCNTYCDSIGGDLLDGEHPWEVRDVGIVVPIGDGRPGSLDGHRSGFAHVRGGHIGEAGGLGQGIRPHQAGDGVVRRREGGDGIANAGSFILDLDGEGGGEDGDGNRIAPFFTFITIVSRFLSLHPDRAYFLRRQQATLINFCLPHVVRIFYFVGNCPGP